MEAAYPVWYGMGGGKGVLYKCIDMAAFWKSMYVPTIGESTLFLMSYPADVVRIFRILKLDIYTKENNNLRPR